MGHHHTHQIVDEDTQNFKVAFFLNLIFTLIEIIGGLYTNSIAILSDAIHDLGDTLTIGTAYFLEKKSKKPANRNYPYGFRRFSLLSALISAMVLLIGSIFIFLEGVKRLLHPEPTDAEGMVVFAMLGVIFNGFAAWKLHSGQSMNQKIISLHLLEDVLGWTAILIGSILLLFFNLPWLDPMLSLGIMVYIMWNVVRRLRETLQLFLQRTPLNINLEDIEKKILDYSEVVAIEHLKIWSLDGAQHVADLKLLVTSDITPQNLPVFEDKIKQLLKPDQIIEFNLAINWK
ncbi:MAG: cation diffusion facilitator family transporter [Flavobacteriaceae bacterium]